MPETPEALEMPAVLLLYRAKHIPARVQTGLVDCPHSVHSSSYGVLPVYCVPQESSSLICGLGLPTPGMVGCALSLPSLDDEEVLGFLACDDHRSGGFNHIC